MIERDVLEQEAAGARFETGKAYSSMSNVTDALASLAEVGQRLDFDSLGAGSQHFLDASRQSGWGTGLSP